MPRPRRNIVTALLFLFMGAASVEAWSCGVHVMGSGTNGSLFTECSVHCIPGLNAAGQQMSVSLHPSMKPCSFSGISPVFATVQPEPALISFNFSDHLTLQDSTLLNINVTWLEHIVTFMNCTNATVSNLTASGCSATAIIGN